MNDESQTNDENQVEEEEQVEDEEQVGDEEWDALATQLTFAFEQRDHEAADFLLDVDRESWTVTLRTGDGVPGEQLTFSLREEDFDLTMPRLARDMVAAALGPE